MAYEIPGQIITLPASTDLSGAQYRFVTAGTDGRAALPANGASVLGVLQNKPTEDQAASIMVSGVSKVECTVASTVATGDLVQSSSIGGAIALAAGGYAVGRVLDGSSGSTGRIFTVMLQPIGTT
jgi:hypothetical protein